MEKHVFSILLNIHKMSVPQVLIYLTRKIMLDCMHQSSGQGFQCRNFVEFNSLIT